MNRLSLCLQGSTDRFKLFKNVARDLHTIYQEKAIGKQLNILNVANITVESFELY